MGLSLDAQAWKKQLMKQLSVSEPMSPAIEEHLTALNLNLCEMITAEIFGLELLWPDDESSTVARGEALGYWCQGFLLGFGLQTSNQDILRQD